jgi:hypothetical protein
MIGSWEIFFREKEQFCECFAEWGFDEILGDYNSDVSRPEISCHYGGV